MNRNAAILGSSALAVLALFLALARSWRGTTAEDVPSLARESRAETDVDATHPVLDGRPSEIEADRRTTEGRTTESAIASPFASSVDAVETDEPGQDPLLVAGRVLDQERSPVYRARVTLGKPKGPFGLPGDIVNDTTTDQQGRFQIRGLNLPEHAELRASKDGYFPSEALSFVKGSRDVGLVLREGGVVVGRVRLDPWIPASKVCVTVEPMQPKPPPPGAIATFRSPPLRLDGEGGFRYGGILASYATVAVRIESDPWVAARVEDVFVPETGESHDPRLDPIDLRGKLEVVTVDVQDESGRKLDRARVQLSARTTPMSDAPAPARAAAPNSSRSPDRTMSTWISKASATCGSPECTEIRWSACGRGFRCGSCCKASFRT
jgi:hypothetical protein